jgi:phospholipase A-2-activating protein
LDLGKGKLVAACEDDNIRTMDKDTKINKIKAHEDEITALIALKEGAFASSSKDKLIKIWKEDALFATLSGHLCSVNCLIQLSFNRHLVSGSCDSTIIVWKDYELLTTLSGHASCVNMLSELKYECFASISADKTMKIWKNNMCIKTLTGYNGQISHFLQLDNDSILAISGNVMKVWS